VIKMSSFMAVRALHDEGVPKKAIARKLGLDRRTVRKYIKRIERGDGRPVRTRVPSKVDPYRDRIVALVERGMTAVQIYLELKADIACAVSYSTIQRLVKTLRPREPEVYCRMQFRPGEEAQIDFGDVGRIEIGGKVRTMWLFVMTLCFSRHSYYDLVLDQTVPTFLGAIRRAFEFFGGVIERLKPDNLKSAVLMNAIGERYYQRDFYSLCKHYGCLPDAARPGTPTDKGRVERDIGYVKESWLRGRTFTSFEDALESLRTWARDVAAVRIHGTTRRRPIDLFEEERSQLRPLPPEAYEIAEFGRYLVRKDCHVQGSGTFTRSRGSSSASTLSCA
jgi:transposase